MNRTSFALLVVLGVVLAAPDVVRAQQPGSVPVRHTRVAPCVSCPGCPDDYCPNPYPRQCGCGYPGFYRCVPAGERALPEGQGRGKDKLTWWFIPTPRALCEALRP